MGPQPRLHVPMPLCPNVNIPHTTIGHAKAVYTCSSLHPALLNSCTCALTTLLHPHTHKMHPNPCPPRKSHPNPTPTPPLPNSGRPRGPTAVEKSRGAAPARAARSSTSRPGHKRSAAAACEHQRQAGRGGSTQPKGGRWEAHNGGIGGWQRQRSACCVDAAADGAVQQGEGGGGAGAAD